MTRPLPLPLLILLAPAAPTLLLALARALRELGAPVPALDPWLATLLWASTTLPLLLLVLGMRAFLARLERDEAAVQEAIRALSRPAVATAEATGLLRKAEGLAAQPAAASRRGLSSADAEDAPAAPARWGGRRAAMAALVVAVLALTSGVAYVLVANPPALPHHEHAAFAVYVDGERASYADAAFDLSTRGFMGAHLHAPDQDVVHLEGTRRATFGEFLERTLLATLEPGRLTLDGVVHGGAAYEEKDGKTLRFYVQPEGGAWRVVMDAAGYVPRQGDRLLLTYGAPDAARLAAEQASVAAEIP